MGVTKEYILETCFKFCSKCNDMKHVSCFPQGHNRCVDCRDFDVSVWSAQNRDKINANQRAYHQTVKGRASTLLNAARKRAKQSGDPITITLADVTKGIETGICAKTFFPFQLEYLGDGQRYQINPFSPSIDKIDPFGIYEKSNVQYVCAWYNLAKGQMSEDDLVMFCKRIASLY